MEFQELRRIPENKKNYFRLHISTLFQLYKTHKTTQCDKKDETWIYPFPNKDVPFEFQGLTYPVPSNF